MKNKPNIIKRIYMKLRGYELFYGSDFMRFEEQLFGDNEFSISNEIKNGRWYWVK